MADEDVAERKRRRDHPCGCQHGRAAEMGKTVFCDLGNAPTALVRLYELIQGKNPPELIIGVPSRLYQCHCQTRVIISLPDTPYIMARRRKGRQQCSRRDLQALIYQLTRK